MKEENEISQTPRIVKSHDIRIDGDYAEWIAELKQKYPVEVNYKVLKKVKQDMLPASSQQAYTIKRKQAAPL